MLGLSFSSKLNWGSYFTSVAEDGPKKMGALIRSTRFLSPEVAFYLYKSTIWPYIEYWSWLALFAATWSCLINYKNGYENGFSFTCY